MTQTIMELSRGHVACRHEFMSEAKLAIVHCRYIREPLKAMCLLIFTFLEFSHSLCYHAIHDGFATEPRFLPLGTCNISPYKIIKLEICSLFELPLLPATTA